VYKEKMKIEDGPHGIVKEYFSIWQFINDSLKKIPKKPIMMSNDPV